MRTLEEKDESSIHPISPSDTKRMAKTNGHELGRGVGFLIPPRGGESLQLEASYGKCETSSPSDHDTEDDGTWKEFVEDGEGGYHEQNGGMRIGKPLWIQG